MYQWLRKQLANIVKIWNERSLIQRLIFIGVAVAVVLAMALLVTLGSSPGLTPLFSRPITDQALLDRISIRLDQENISYQISNDQRILVSDERVARRLRALLTREDLIPQELDPWELFDMERWTQTDFERNVNLQRALTRQLEQHIEALDDVDSASVTLVIPETELFTENQNPVTASVIIAPKPNSDIRENRLKVEGIQKLIQFAVEGLLVENLTISDRNGISLNDFEGRGSLDRIEIARRELRVEQEVEQRYIEAIRQALGQIYGEGRVEIINIDVTIDMGKYTQETEEFYPVVTIPDNPDTPFDERQFVLAIPRSTEVIREDYEGTGFNPEGPPGQEGQTPPAYQDLEDLVGRYSNDEDRINNEINTRRTYEERSPAIRRITASVALDGVWKWQYDEAGILQVNPDGSIVREYEAIGIEELADAEALVRNAVGFDQSRGDAVSVRHIQFDRSDEQRREDIAYRRSRQTRLIILYGLIGIGVALILFILIRLIFRELERQRRLKAEEIERQHLALREAQLDQEEQSVGVQMSVEERARSEMREGAINMVRENPDGVAQLLRNWLTEEY